MNPDVVSAIARLRIVLFALSLVTLRHDVHIAPLWVMLTLSGGALVVLALAVERALRRATRA